MSSKRLVVRSLQDLSRQLDQDGFVVLPELIPAHFLARLNDRIDRLFEQEGDAAGAEFKQEAGCRRLANLVNKGTVFQQAIEYEPILCLVRQVLGDTLKLSSLNVRAVDPLGTSRQPLHADMAALPDSQGPWVCNVLWMLQEIHLENGPLRVVPGTHRSGRLPQQVLQDPMAPHPQEILVTGRAGTIVVFNAHLWHGGLENRSPMPRRAMHAFYCRRDKPQQQYQKRLLSADVQSALSPSLRELLALDDPQNDRLSGQVETTSGFMK